MIGKVLLSLVLVLIIVLALLQIPAIQKQITPWVADYLSAKIKSRVEIGRIQFSMTGDASIEGLKVWDPAGDNFFSATKIVATSSLVELISGNIIFDEIHLAGLDGKLIQNNDALNIQFIIDAFQGPKSSTPSSGTVKVQFKSIVLEDIALDYNSPDISVIGKIGRFITTNFEFSTNPNKISADKVNLENSVVNIISRSQTTTTNEKETTTRDSLTIGTPFSPDFGAGIIFDVKDLQLKENDFSYHKDQVEQARKFDPSHLDLKKILVSLSDILINPDTLTGALHALSAQLPGFSLTNAMSGISLGRDLLALSDLNILTDSSEVMADFSGGSFLSSGDNNKDAHLQIDTKCRINPREAAYFLSDSIMKYFSHWKTTELRAQGSYADGKGEIKTLDVKTGKSRVEIQGIIHDVLDNKKVTWRGVSVHASVGADIRQTLKPFLRNVIELPPDISFDVSSSGNLKEAFVDGKFITTWGNVSAKGVATDPLDKLAIDMAVTGEAVELGKWIKVSTLGPIDLSASAKGSLARQPNIEVNGLINSIEILNEPIRKIDFKSTLKNDTLNAILAIEDPNYRSQIDTDISFAGPFVITNNVHFEGFCMGRLLQGDSTLSISGDMKSSLKLDDNSIEGYIESDSVLFANQSIKYFLDSLAFHAAISPAATNVDYYTNHGTGRLTANFDIRESQLLIAGLIGDLLNTSENIGHVSGKRTINFDLEFANANLFQLLNVDVDNFSSLNLTGGLDEQERTITLHVSAVSFKGYGISLDTLRADVATVESNITSDITAMDLFYNSIKVGNINFDVLTKNDTATSNLVLSNDSITTLSMHSRIFRGDSGVFIYTDKLQAFENDFRVDQKSPVYIDNKRVRFDQFSIARNDMEINLDGDASVFDVNFKNVDLTPLNLILFPDTTVINSGHLTGKISYARDQKLDLKAKVDSLRLYNSNPLTIEATAVTEGNRVPFDFLLTNSSNRIDLKGNYLLNNDEIDASMVLDVNNLELFAFLLSGVMEEMNGTIKGEAKIGGHLQQPQFEGQLRFLDARFTTSNPRLKFNLHDDVIKLNNSGIAFDKFTVYDEGKNPLTIDGNISTKDYRSFSYDLHVKTDRFNLVNNPDSSSRRLRGMLVVASDIKLTGNEKDTNVKAGITIKKETNLTFVTTNNDIELLKAEGVIEFIDPELLLDSASNQLTQYFYDSLIASLPDFNLNSTLTIEDDATIRIVIDEQSGDYIEASGGGTLDMSYDRTGNVNLSGSYTIKKGIYRLSFYDLVKKNFALVPGSSINWTGSPQNGDLDIKAVHTVETNSIGLIGQEVGENEKSIYKRSLDYQVGINIKGTIDKPIVSFSLDLPKEEKANYPVLANKLERLKQPEYGSELNKQVFGLLVLGGFLPETTGTDINQNVVATTALSNSVNAILATQLNRFAAQYVKGVNIDVGIQSYADYSAPGGKTRTAMDFRVSKSVMNDRLSFEIGGDFDINQDQSGSKTGNNYRGDIAIIYDLTGGGDKQLKLFNNETYDIIYQEIRNTGISLIFIREFDKDKKRNNEGK